MTFIAVEFITNDDNPVMGIAHSSWLLTAQNKVWWPPYKSGCRINKALLKSEIPDEEKWELCAIKRILFKHGLL